MKAITALSLYERMLRVANEYCDTPESLAGARLMMACLTDEAVEAIEIPHWIPCSERLPSDGEYVLVTEKWHGYVWMWRLQHIDDEPTWDVNGYNIDIDEAVAWMPLPESYRKEGNNETD